MHVLNYVFSYVPIRFNDTVLPFMWISTKIQREKGSICSMVTKPTSVY